VVVPATSHYDRRRRVRFYTDAQGRVRPITPRKSHSQARRPFLRANSWRPWRILNPQTPEDYIGHAVLEASFATLAASSPFVGQVYASYQLAKGIYGAYKSARAVTSAYETQGPVGAAKIIGTELLSKQLTGVQTELGWDLIGNRIDPKAQAAAKSLLTECVETLTAEEIDFVSRHLV